MATPTYIPASEMFPTLTTILDDKYDEVVEITATQYLQSFGIDVMSQVLYPAIDVRRGTEQVAIDVVLGADGNRHQLTEFSRTIYDLFFYDDFVDLNKLKCYQLLFASTALGINEGNIAANEIMVGLKAIEDLQIRAVETMFAQILEFGTITSPKDGSVIQYGRRASSFNVLGSGNWWNVSGHDPYADFSTAGDFLRKFGKYQTMELVAIVGEAAFLALKNNSVVLIQNDLKSWQIDQLIKPMKMADGACYMGYIVAYNYTVHLFAYNQYYENPANNNISTAYINPNNVYVLPNPSSSKPFTSIYGAVPQIVANGSNITGNLQTGKRIRYEKILPQMSLFQFGLQSRPLVVPKKIDQMYTIQVLPS